MGRTPVDYSKVDKLLKEQAKRKSQGDHSLTDAKLAEQAGCSRMTVYTRKKALRRAASIQEAEKIAKNHGETLKGRQLMGPWTDALQRADNPEEWLKWVDDQPILSARQSMAIMSALSQDPRMPPAVRTQADARLQALREKHAPPETLGPGPPLSRSDKVQRLKAILEACGQEIAAEAWKEMQWTSASSNEPIAEITAPSAGEELPHGNGDSKSPTTTAETTPSAENVLSQEPEPSLPPSNPASLEVPVTKVAPNRTR